MLHQVLFSLTCSDIVYKNNSTSTNILFKVSASDGYTSVAVNKKNYHKHIRFCHPDHHPEVDRNILQQLVAILNILADPITRKIYPCGFCATMRKNSSHSCCICSNMNPWMTFGTIAGPLSLASSTMRGRIPFNWCKMTPDLFTFKSIMEDLHLSFFYFLFPSFLCFNFKACFFLQPSHFYCIFSFFQSCNKTVNCIPFGRPRVIQVILPGQTLF